MPRKIRQEIGDSEIVLSRGFDTCIFGFDRSSWEAEAAKQLTPSVTEEKGRALRRYFFAAAEKIEIDKLGRILLPAQLKEYASIRSEVVVIGAGDHFEIWSKEKWSAYSTQLATHG